MVRLALVLLVLAPGLALGASHFEVHNTTGEQAFVIWTDTSGNRSTPFAVGACGSFLSDGDKLRADCDDSSSVTIIRVSDSSLRTVAVGTNERLEIIWSNVGVLTASGYPSGSVIAHVWRGATPLVWFWKGTVSAFVFCLGSLLVLRIIRGLGTSEPAVG